MEKRENTFDGHLFLPGEITAPRLTYHEITDQRSSYRYSLTSHAFTEHITDLQQFKEDRPGSYVTFDDGHISQLINAVPILDQFNERATFFVTAGWTGQRSGYMTWNHLRELQTCGHEVQSHGWSHVLLTQCSLPVLRRELYLSKNKLEDHLGTRVDAISMPGGRCSQQVLDVCAAVGYTTVFTSDPWSSNSSIMGIHIIGRWMVTRDMRAGDVIRLLRRKGGHIQYLRARHQIKEVAKSLIGDRAYHAVWRALSQKKLSLEDHHSAPANKPR